MYKKIFLISTLIAQQSFSQNEFTLAQAPMKTASQHYAIRHGLKFETGIRNIVMECAPFEIKMIINKLKDPYCPNTLKFKRILLHGPSGSGKSTLAQVFAQEIGRTCIFANCGFLGNEYQNSIATTLNQIIREASKQPTVIVLDEMGRLINKTTSLKEDIRTQFLNFLDTCDQNPNITIIGTVNTLKNIDPSIQTRFGGTTLLVSGHSIQAQRKKIFLHILQKLKHNLNEHEINNFFNSTNDLSIRDLEIFFQWAQLCSEDRKSSIISKIDLTISLSIIRKGIDSIRHNETLYESVKTYLNEHKGEIFVSGTIGFALNQLTHNEIPKQVVLKTIEVTKDTIIPKTQQFIQKHVTKKLFLKVLQLATGK